MFLVGNHLAEYPYIMRGKEVRRTIRWFAATQLKVNKEHLVEAATKVAQALYADRREAHRKEVERIRLLNRNLFEAEKPS
jgi:hypothetical protein